MQNPILLLKNNSQSSEKIKKPSRKRFLITKILIRFIKIKLKKLDILCIEWNLLTTLSQLKEKTCTLCYITKKYVCKVKQVSHCIES